MGKKGVDCLQLASLSALDYDIWHKEYIRLCGKYSEKAVCKKMEDLAAKGYIEYGVSARTGWLTDKGRCILGEVGRPA